MIDGQNFLMYGNIQKIVTGQGDDYTTSSLLDYSYFNKYYKMIAIDLIRQQALDADPKVMQQIKIAGNLNSDEDVNDNTTTMFLINEESKETILDFWELEYCTFFVSIEYQCKITQYSPLNVKLFKIVKLPQLNKLKSGIKDGTKVTFKLSSNVVGDSNNENDFLHKLLLTNTQVSRNRKAFANNFSAKVKSPKPQFHKIGQAEGFLGRLLGLLLKIGLPLMNDVLKPLAKNDLIPLELTPATSATDAAIHEKMFESGRPPTLALRPLDNF